MPCRLNHGPIGVTGMSFTASTLSADRVRAAIERKRAEQREKRTKQAATAKAELARLGKELAQRQVKPQALELIVSLIDKAVEREEREAMVMRFPSEWLADHG